MSELIFCGYSDDVIEVEGCGIHEEFGAWNEPRRLLIAGSDGSAMVVVGEYSKPGVWMFGVQRDDEDRPVWPASIRTSDSCAYSVELTVAVPDGVTVTVEKLS